ncbi:uncharacterized protein MYCFIDRAFT_177583 [Pseudocercospora fijiensis CIRAD86]|uniref:Uncharacterized protein n=1 Tax=Pseudocercospora fijiensis (strain CIRAD86) TaxID=383855 RepID=M3AU31_PSEFD|nr:uncharacterized protein MYCFIDRAFT_177583 [Pseudocercospora fijiensis CIRAD86]EME80653.1 hypothetical protein MYCFIDRAFT_177583 [Pseudocercospora fijiensis CIRAD86]
MPRRIGHDAGKLHAFLELQSSNQPMSGDEQRLYGHKDLSLKPEQNRQSWSNFRYMFLVSDRARLSSPLLSTKRYNTPMRKNRDARNPYIPVPNTSYTHEQDQHYIESTRPQLSQPAHPHHGLDCYDSTDQRKASPFPLSQALISFTQSIVLILTACPESRAEMRLQRVHFTRAPRNIWTAWVQNPHLTRNTFLHLCSKLAYSCFFDSCVIQPSSDPYKNFFDRHIPTIHDAETQGYGRRSSRIAGLKREEPDTEKVTNGTRATPSSIKTTSQETQAVGPVTPNGSDASQKVFGVPELLSMILGYLDLASLARLLPTNILFNHQGRSAPQLKPIWFLSPTHEEPVRYCVSRTQEIRQLDALSGDVAQANEEVVAVYQINPILEVPPDEDAIDSASEQERILSLEGHTDIEFPYQLVDSSRWIKIRDMQLTKPAIQDIQFNYAPDDEDAEKVNLEITNSNGITIGNIMNSVAARGDAPNTPFLKARLWHHGDNRVTGTALRNILSGFRPNELGRPMLLMQTITMAEIHRTYIRRLSNAMLSGRGRHGKRCEHFALLRWDPTFGLRVSRLHNASTGTQWDCKRSMEIFHTSGLSLSSQTLLMSTLDYDSPLETPNGVTQLTHLEASLASSPTHRKETSSTINMKQSASDFLAGSAIKRTRTEPPPQDKHMTEDHLQATTAASSVTNTAELVEEILLNLSLHDLATALRTNHFFRNVAFGSVKIKQALFLLPAADDAVQYLVDSSEGEIVAIDSKSPPPALNVHQTILTAHLLNPVLKIDQSKPTNTPHACSYLKHEDKITYGRHILLPYHAYAQSNLRDMLVLQPPVSHLSFTAKPDPSGPVINVNVTNVNGEWLGTCSSSPVFFGPMVFAWLLQKNSASLQVWWVSAVLWERSSYVKLLDVALPDVEEVCRLTIRWPAMLDTGIKQFKTDDSLKLDTLADFGFLASPLAFNDFHSMILAFKQLQNGI